MSLLTPLFLLGALAVALPVVFHLIRRTTRERAVFSSLMFLLPTTPRLTRRSRLEHLLLLVLRCAVLCLLAFGFARPFIKKAVSSEPSASGARRIVLLVDISASMRRADLWADARQQAQSILRKTSSDDQVALFTFDRQLHPLVTFEQWNGAPSAQRVTLAARKLAEISPGWAATHLGNALIAAAEMLADNSGKTFTGSRQIVLISDLQEGCRLDPLQGYEWPKGIEVTIVPLKARHPSNASLQLITDANAVDSIASSSVRVRVSNSADSRRDQFKVGWARPDGHGFVTEPVEVYVPPGQSRVVPLAWGGQAPNPTQAPSPIGWERAGVRASSGQAPITQDPPNLPAESVRSTRILLQGDEEDFDNSVFVIPPDTARLSVLYLGNDAEKDARQPLYFLQRAFQDTQRQKVSVLARRGATPLPATETSSAALFIVSDALAEESARALRDRVADGKTLLFALRNEACAPTLEFLLGLNHLTVQEARPPAYAMLAEMDFRHPLLAPFADPRFSDFTKIHFWKYRQVDATAIPNARVVAKFDTGDPAILEIPIGRGRVLLLTSGWQPDDSQLALSTKFVPFLYSLLEASGGAAPPPAQFHVGDVVPLPSVAGALKSALTVRAPDGSELTLAAGETNFTKTFLPGIYTLSPPTRRADAPSQRGGQGRGEGNFSDSQPQKSARFAVNLDDRESRTAPLPGDELERLGVPLSHQPTVASHSARQTRLQNAELEARQKLWRWFIVATMVVLLLETWLAGRTARRQETQVDAAT